jgi:hypothetical protein
MSTVYLRGGGVIQGAQLGAERWHKAVDAGDAILTFRWQPGFTPHDPASFTITVLTEEIAAVQEVGR